MNFKTRIGVVPKETPRKTVKYSSWRVEWKIKDFPGDWLLFCRSKTFPSEAVSAYEEAIKRPGCIDARIVERVVTTTEEIYEVSVESLKGRV